MTQHSKLFVHLLDSFVSLGRLFFAASTNPQQTPLPGLFNPPGGAGSAPEAQDAGDNPRHFPTTELLSSR